MSQSEQRAPRLWRLVELTTLAAFAFSQPLYAVLAENPTFLVAHELAGGRLVVFALALTVVPALVLGALDELLGMAPLSRAGRLRAGLRGTVFGLVLGPPANVAAGLDGPVALVLLAVAMIGGVLLFVRVEVATQLARMASFAVPVFIGAFLFMSPASGLLGSEDVDPVAALGVEETSVVWLVFDQLPLGLLMDEEGRIAADRFPNFARLARTSTWYPRATTVSGSTTLAMPSTLAGRFAEPRGLPVASEYPVNLFTLLAGTHEMHVFENVTQLCPPSVCGEATASSRQGDQKPDSTARDTWIVLVRTILPDAVADHFVPETNSRWSGFDENPSVAVPDGSGEATSMEEIKAARASGDDRERFEAFLDTIGTADGAALHYMHLEKPHEPLLFVPDGRIYDKCKCYEVDADGRWPHDPAMTRQRLQRYLLQSMHVDRLLGQVLDRLEETGLEDETLLVVMSDHGVATLPGLVNKTLTEQNLDEVLPIPLMVRYPGQRSPSVESRTAQVTDLLPTALDVLGVVAEHGEFVGHSLLEAAPPDVMPVVITENGTRALETVPAAVESGYIEWMQTLYPDQFNPYAQGPAASLVGDVPSRTGDSRLTVSLHNAAQLGDVELGTGYVPAHLIGELHGSDGPVELAVAVNGTVAGVGTTFWNEIWRVSIMIDPDHLVDGTNTLQFYEVAERGLLAVPFD